MLLSMAGWSFLGEASTLKQYLRGAFPGLREKEYDHSCGSVSANEEKTSVFCYRINMLRAEIQIFC